MINTFVKEGCERFQSNSMPRNLRSSKKRVELELKGIEKNKKLLPGERKKLLKRSLDLNKAVEKKIRKTYGKELKSSKI